MTQKIHSMTGFGRFTVQRGQKKITVEMKSVNHRYLDLSVKMSKRFNPFEADIRNYMKEAVARGQAREEEILRKANAEASAIMDKASADIEMEKKKAINDAKDEISEMAMAIAGKVVGRELTAADQASLVDHFINELGEQA